MLIKTSIAAALLFSAAAPAIAGQESESVSEAVSFADLNLATPAGIARLDDRIERAIRRLCRHPSRSIADLLGNQQVRQCQREAWASIAARRSAALAAASPASSGLGAGGTR